MGDILDESRDRCCCAVRGLSEMTKKTLLFVEIVEEQGARFLISSYSDGEVVREAVVPKKARPPRLGLRPALRIKDYTRKKKF